jgi:hypothetical protein
MVQFQNGEGSKVMLPLKMNLQLPYKVKWCLETDQKSRTSGQDCGATCGVSQLMMLNMRHVLGLVQSVGIPKWSRMLQMLQQGKGMLENVRKCQSSWTEHWKAHQHLHISGVSR